MNIKEVSEMLGISPDTLRYYERVGAIPPITRTPGGVRDYSERDLANIHQTVCFRNAGLSIEALVEYRRLCDRGDSSLSERLQLLTAEREKLLRQQRQLEEALNRLNYKIARYEVAVETGSLSWEKNS